MVDPIRVELPDQYAMSWDGREVHAMRPGGAETPLFFSEAHDELCVPRMEDRRLYRVTVLFEPVGQ